MTRLIIGVVHPFTRNSAKKIVFIGIFDSLIYGVAMLKRFPAVYFPPAIGIICPLKLLLALRLLLCTASLRGSFL